MENGLLETENMKMYLHVDWENTNKMTILKILKNRQIELVCTILKIIANFFEIIFQQNS